VGFDKTAHPIPKVCSFNIVIRQVSCGEDHTAFVVEPSGQVYSMGSNQDGKLGVGQAAMRSSNVPCLVENLQGIVKVACGSSHTLAISESGQAYSWGLGFSGALGTGESSIQDKPRMITAIHSQRIIDIDAGSKHSLFLTESLRVYGCGEAKMGQLGVGSVVQDRLMVPTNIKALNEFQIQKVNCGKFHSLFLT
jgi:alpha-tubulin suppressor-like RCC1 family protein